MYFLYAVAREKIGETKIQESHNIKRRKKKSSRKRGFLILLKMMFIKNPLGNYSKMQGINTENGNILSGKVLTRDWLNESREKYLLHFVVELNDTMFEVIE